MSDGVKDRAQRTVSHKPPLPGQRLVVFIVKTLACVLVVYGVLFGTLIVAELISPLLTAVVTPAAYPASRIVGTEAWGSSGGIRTTTIYQTPDDSTRVRAYFEQAMPGFRSTILRPIGRGKQDTDGYWNDACNASILSDIVGRIITSSPFGHCASVIIYSDPSRNDGTYIELTVSYPTS